MTSSAPETSQWAAGSVLWRVIAGVFVATALVTTAIWWFGSGSDASVSPAAPRLEVLDGEAPGDVSSPTALSEAGAAVAAASFMEDLGGLVFVPAEELWPRLRAMTTGDGFSSVEEVVNAELVPLRWALDGVSPQITWAATRSLTVEVEDLDVDAGVAFAQVWAVQVFSRVEVLDPEVRFRMANFRLVFADDRWLIDGWVPVDAPAALLAIDQLPVSAGDLDDMLEGHRLMFRWLERLDERP